MSKLNQIKIPVDVKTYKLVRERDGLTIYGTQISWVQWDRDGRFKDRHETPAVGLSLIVDPQRMNFTWLTTPITVIVKEKEGYIKFKTENSIYELWQQ
jgi:hypothetical protein